MKQGQVLGISKKFVYGYKELEKTFGKEQTEDFRKVMNKAGYFSIKMNNGTIIYIELPEEKSAKKEAPLFADKRA